jgi:hypothetical protein
MGNERIGGTVTQIYLELGAKRAFACALEWPGWCRSGSDEEKALASLAAYAPRYALVAAEAGFPLPPSAATRFEVIDELAGSATTDFGAPAEIAARDFDPLDHDADRFVSLVSAAWTVLDQIAGNAPVELRKGPRGGGRNRDKIVEHILGAEAAYARKLGVRLRQPEVGQVAAIASFRAATLDAIRGALGPPETSWPPRYAARRIAWHVLDHAWEIEDRSSPL